MNTFATSQEEPSIIFPIGAIIEDVKGKYKILEFEKQDKAHKYKVEVLEQKIQPPQNLVMFLDPKIQYILVLPQNLPNITRLE